MYDMTVRQLDQRIAEYHRMMARTNGADSIATSPRKQKQVRVVVAQALRSLAIRLAPARPESRSV